MNPGTRVRHKKRMLCLVGVVVESVDSSHGKIWVRWDGTETATWYYKSALVELVDRPDQPERPAAVSLDRRPGRGRPAHALTIGGVTKRIDDWARVAGISAITIRRRLACGATEHELLRPTAVDQPRYEVVVDHVVQLFTVRELAARCGMRPETLRQRLVKGWPVALAMDPNYRPPRGTPAKRPFTINGLTMSANAWARHYKIAWRTVRERMKRRGWSFRRALTTPLDQKQVRGWSVRRRRKAAE